MRALTSSLLSHKGRVSALRRYAAKLRSCFAGTCCGAAPGIAHTHSPVSETIARQHEPHRHAGVAQHPALRERLVGPQQACGTCRVLDLADLDGSRAAEKRAHELGRLRPGGVEAPRLTRPELARAQRMILRLKRNPRRALALLHNVRGDAERERPGVGCKLILHLQAAGAASRRPDRARSASRHVQDHPRASRRMPRAHRGRDRPAARWS